MYCCKLLNNFMKKTKIESVLCESVLTVEYLQQMGEGERKGGKVQVERFKL